MATKGDNIMPARNKEIMQKPVTEGMTDAERAEWTKMVREEQRGNTGNPWQGMKLFGIGSTYSKTAMSLSDDVSYHKETENKKEEFIILAERSNKGEAIKRWIDRTKKNLVKLEAIKKDTSLTDEERARKIARYNEVIANDKFTIIQAMEFLGKPNAQAIILYNQLTKIK